MRVRFPHIPALYRTLLVAVLWLAVISALHYRLNGEPEHPDKVCMGYMPVIANLAAPLADAASREGGLRLEAVKFGSFADIAEAFKSGGIQAAFIIAPLAVALYEQGVPLKVVYIGNRNESTLAVRKDLACQSLADLAGKTIAVPIRYSGHHLAIRRGLRELGLDPGAVKIVEVPPPEMPSALASGGVDGIFVGEPFATAAIAGGAARKLLFAEELWPRFICNLLIVSDDLVLSHPERVEALVGAAARSGLWAEKHLDEAIGTVGPYWGQKPEVIRRAFESPPGRVRFDLFIPKAEEMEEIAREMQLAGMISRVPDVKGLVDDRFARAVRIDPVSSLKEILPR